MFERFQTEARDVLARTNTVARELRSPFIRRHHILIALIDGDDPVVGSVFSGFDTAALRSLLVTSVQATEEPVDNDDSKPFSGGAKKALEVALREALSLGHNFIAPYHLLLSVLRTADGPLEDVLGATALTYGKAHDVVRAEAPEPELRRRIRREATRKMGRRGRDASRGVEGVLTEAARAAGSRRAITTGDLLVALAQSENTHAAQILATINAFDTEAVAAAAAAMVDSGAQDGGDDPIQVDPRSGAVTITDPKIAEAIKNLAGDRPSHERIAEILKRLQSDG